MFVDNLSSRKLPTMGFLWLKHIAHEGKCDSLPFLRQAAIINKDSTCSICNIVFGQLPLCLNKVYLGQPWEIPWVKIMQSSKHGQKLHTSWCYNNILLIFFLQFTQTPYPCYSLSDIEKIHKGKTSINLEFPPQTHLNMIMALW